MQSLNWFVDGSFHLLGGNCIQRYVWYQWIQKSTARKGTKSTS